MGFSVPCLELKKGKCPTLSPQWGPIEVTQEIPGHPSTHGFSFSSVSSFPLPEIYVTGFVFPSRVRNSLWFVCKAAHWVLFRFPSPQRGGRGGAASGLVRGLSLACLPGDTGSTVEELTGSVSQG